MKKDGTQEGLLPKLPKKVQLQLWRLMHEMTLPDLLLLMRIYHGLAWCGDTTDLFAPEMVELLVETGLVLRLHPDDHLLLTPAGEFLAMLVERVWPGKPRAAGMPLPPDLPKPKPRPPLRLVTPSQ